ncbi:glycosyltransferase family 4 protein [Halovenus sp. HT40]|uniref:glycosyltransferase family 4 protein n=1 Tax=Halovenus sp. HT40 TaxID=3126691 RepID=UPI00300F48B8
MERLSVCHVVNALGDTSMPGDLATTQASLDSFGRVGVLSWFDIDTFQGIDSIETVCLDVPDTFRITSEQYATVKSVFEGYDLIHTHHPHSGFYAKLIATRLGKPIIHTEHNNHDGFTRKGRAANGLTNPLVDSVACVSESVRESLFRWERTLLADSKVSVINNGVNLDRLEAATNREWSIYDATEIGSSAIVVGSAGMLTEQKAHDVLIDGVGRANNRSDRPIELVISGDGELREQLTAQIERTGHSDRLHLLGFLDEREQVYKMMDEIDIYAMPSRWEGFCVAALEGLALGNACLFSEIPEFTEPFGQVAQFHDLNDPEDVADNLVTLVEDEQLRMELGKSAERLIRDQYTLEQTTRHYLEAYTELL